LKNTFLSQHNSLYIEALVPSFHKPLKTSSTQFFGLLSEPGSHFPFRRYHDEGHDMLTRIVTGDESWVHHYQPETKRASMHPASPARKKFKVTPSSRKVISTVFWDHEGILLTTFQTQGKTVNADSYCNILRKLRNAIQRK
jgi:hypothetical protein